MRRLRRPGRRSAGSSRSLTVRTGSPRSRAARPAVARPPVRRPLPRGAEPPPEPARGDSSSGSVRRGGRAAASVRRWSPAASWWSAAVVVVVLGGRGDGRLGWPGDVVGLRSRRHRHRTVGRSCVHVVGSVGWWPAGTDEPRRTMVVVTDARVGRDDEVELRVVAAHAAERAEQSARDAGPGPAVPLVVGVVDLVAARSAGCRQAHRTRATPACVDEHGGAPLAAATPAASPCRPWKP